MSEEKLQDEREQIKGQAWNDCITPRKEPIRQWFKAPEWTGGVGAYLTYQRDALQKLLNAGCDTQRKEDVLRGRILMLQELIDLPTVIDRQIDLAESVKERPKPSGTAGY